MSDELDQPSSYNFTAEALEANNEALKSLKRQGVSECDVEDLLLGLLQVKGGTARRILDQLDYDVDGLREALGRRGGDVVSDDSPEVEDLQHFYTDLAAAIRNEAREICKRESGHDYIGPAHLVAAILSSADDQLTGLLAQYGRHDSEHLEYVLGRYINTKKRLGWRVGWQEEAAGELADAVRRTSEGLRDPRQPIGVYLLEGEPDIGQAELAVGLAENLFGDEEMVVRLDMSNVEYRDDVTRLFGSKAGPGGGKPGGLLTDAVSACRTCVVLLSDVAEAHPDAIDALLAIFNGVSDFTDSDGKTVDFRHTVFIMTSSIGADSDSALESGVLINADVALPPGRSGTGHSPGHGTEMENAFPPEIRNRIDQVIKVRPLSSNDLGQVLNAKFVSLDSQLEQHQISVEVTQVTRDWFVKRNTGPESSAKTMMRLFDDHVAAPLFKGIREQTFRYGSIVLLDLDDGELVLRPDRPNPIGDLFLRTIRGLPVGSLIRERGIDVRITLEAAEWLADEVRRLPDQGQFEGMPVGRSELFIERHFGRSKLHAVRRVANRYLASPIASWFMKLGIDDGAFVIFDSTGDDWTMSLSTIDLILKLTDSGEHAWWMRGDVPSTIGIPVRRLINEGALQANLVSSLEDYIPEDLWDLLERWLEHLPEPLIKWILARSSEMGMDWPSRASGTWFARSHHPSQVRQRAIREHNRRMSNDAEAQQDDEPQAGSFFDDDEDDA